MSAVDMANDGESLDNNCSTDAQMDESGQDDHNPEFDQPNQSKNRKGSRRRSKGGGLHRGGWRGFNEVRGWGPPMPPRPPQIFGQAPRDMEPMWGRGFGPGGPPIQRSMPDNNMPIRYLMRCGVPKEKLRNLPRDFLQLIYPEHCGVCNVELPSFEISREHYISRFHYKKQKAWTFRQYQPFEGGHSRPKKEAPLKARDIYCELCDVQITSKVHADSHYSGKPHRAVVEGRKQPKNEKLLKKGMENRLDQLIRREKKNLQPVEEEPKPEVPEKPIQPELFCDICKTSVTCSEQMRMHLNGRKHLTKEKQHILKMMRGDGANNDKVTAEVGDADKSGVGDPESQTEQAENDETKYDWGNGSGAWEEDPQEMK